MEHAHYWRATSKVFAMVCECGVVYHDWLVAEIGLLKKGAVAAAPPPAAAPASIEEVAALRAQLEEARREAASLRGELDEARRELEAQAQKVSAQIAAT